MRTCHPVRALVAICCVLAACSSSTTGSTTPRDAASTVLGTTSSTIAAAPPTAAPATDTPTINAPTNEAPTTTAAGVGEWETITAPSDCMCMGGQAYSYFVRRGDPTKVVFFLQGGGACATAATCAPDSPVARHEVVDPFVGGNDHYTGGIFDAADPRNPFAGWSMVFVPYCTGDVHLGNVTATYAGGVVAHHNGFVNATTALRQAAATFPGATQFLVAGESAGSSGSPIYGALAADLLPAAQITVLADSSGGFKDTPEAALLFERWGTRDALATWPDTTGFTDGAISQPGLFDRAAQHAPGLVFIRHDYAHDKVQSLFLMAMGSDPARLLEYIDTNNQRLRDDGVPVHTWVAGGDTHTVLHEPAFFTETIDGVAFVDWVAAVVNRQPLPDVHCTDCAVA